MNIDSDRQRSRSDGSIRRDEDVDEQTECLQGTVGAGAGAPVAGVLSAATGTFPTTSEDCLFINGIPTITVITASQAISTTMNIDSDRQRSRSDGSIRAYRVVADGSMQPLLCSPKRMAIISGSRSTTVSDTLDADRLIGSGLNKLDIQHNFYSRRPAFKAPPSATSFPAKNGSRRTSPR
jgi:hypothetical protein